MPMSAERVVELCNLSVNAINEDIALLEAGALEWRAPTKLNVTRQQLFRDAGCCVASPGDHRRLRLRLYRSSGNGLNP